MIKYFTILPIVSHLIFVIVKYGVQKSISESYYRLTEKEHPLFFWALVLTSLNFIAVQAFSNPNNIQVILMFFAGLGISYTAAAAQFKKNKIVETWHMIGAYGGFILGYVFIVFKYDLDAVYFIIPSLLTMWVFARYQKNTYIWWVEIIVLLTIYLATL